MFDKMKDMGKLLKQAKEIKGKMKDVQSELKRLTVTGTDKHAKVIVKLTGELECVGVQVDPSLLDAGQKPALEKALQTAFNSAAKKSKDMATEKLSDISGGLNLPGLG